MLVDIIVPCFNEARQLETSLNQFIELSKSEKILHRVILVNDGSFDQTGHIIDHYVQSHTNLFHGIHLKHNYGKGAAIKAGISACQSDYIFFCDADLSTPLEEIPPALNRLTSENADIIIGTRANKRSTITKRQPKIREAMGKTFNTLMRWATGLHFRDTQCGFKGFKKNALEMAFYGLKTKGFAFDVEILLRAQCHGLIILEQPVKWHHEGESKVHLLKTSLAMFGELVKIKLLFHYENT